MVCPRCGSDVSSSTSDRCSICGTALSMSVADAPTVVAADAETRLGPPIAASTSHANTGPLAVGQNFGPRYHVIRCIGAGGMGAVYQAWDQELEVAVAVKVIRPDVSADPLVAEELERRFKRELLLARQVTHRNVVRIHDIGEINGIKYITMPYVQGADLSTVLRRENKLPLARALTVGRQIVEGLVAAHDAGVVHRDLKPANVMVDAEDHAVIMDFGIARSTSNAPGLAMTVAGAVVGTLEYMAPEQARGEAVDQRADIYAFGLILRDMLLGGRHAASTTAVAELMSRMQQPPPPARTVDPSIPASVDDVLTTCLQPDPAARYQTSAELLKALDRLASPGAEPTVRRSARFSRRHIAAAVVLILAVAAGVFALVTKGSPPAESVPGETITLAVLPFRNATGDPALNSLGTTLSEVLATDLGEARNIRLIAPQRLQEVLGDLRIEANTSLSTPDLKRIGHFASAGTVLWGQYVKFGEEIRIDATLQDLAGDRRIPLKATAPRESGVLEAVATLAAAVQQELARGSADVLKQLQATAWRPTTASVAALGFYNEGLQLTRDGNHQTALKRFQAAIQEDPAFALAHSALAQAYASLGYDAEATQYSRRAMSLGESLPAGQEKYLIAAAHHRIANDAEKAIETYGRLVAVAPNSARIHYELAQLYEQEGNFEKAQEHYGKAVAIDARHVAGLTAVGRVSIRRGDPQASLQPLNAALSLAVELDNNEARATALHAIGIAYKRLGRPNDALVHYQQSLDLRRGLGDKRGMSVSLSEIAQVQETVGQAQDAVKSYNDALALQREIGNKEGMAMTLINLGSLTNETLGQPDRALPLLREALTTLRETGNRSGEALALNNMGSAYLAKGDFSEAQTYFERALELRARANVSHEMADTLHNLGETLNRMGRFDQALDRYLKALELRRKDANRRMEAIESYSIGTVFDYQGRYGAAIRSKTEALAAFRGLKQRDFWLAEILSGHGASLALGGRLEDAAKSLDEALTLGRELKNNVLVAQTLRAQSDRLLFAGDAPAAAQAAAAAVETARRTSDRSLQLWAEMQVARTAAATKPSRTLATTLDSVGRQAGGIGSVYLSVLSSVAAAETLLRAGDHQGAGRAVTPTLARAEALGLRELAARCEYVVATSLRLANDRAARQHYAAVVRILGELGREEGAGQLLQRADLQAMHADSERWVRGS